MKGNRSPTCCLAPQPSGLQEKPDCHCSKDLYMGGQTSDLVELIIRRVNGAVQPDPLIAELERWGRRQHGLGMRWRTFSRFRGVLHPDGKIVFQGHVHVFRFRFPIFLQRPWPVLPPSGRVTSIHQVPQAQQLCGIGAKHPVAFGLRAATLYRDTGCKCQANSFPRV